ncbi:hypothetical protein J1770_gp32 [Gordonia phage EMoore]|uniref:Uncharacterized protein n=1 Tax=Gordonia phage EMoore TaxID=2656534 RepID=A0A649VU42_9CAUD|nr:hypothetical protein J1770_gp32 [Gordonia phage EMoore]QGJ95818.1 hypothetical protein SEA_EMOORE_32 [Gordonia phage EMoore]
MARRGNQRRRGLIRDDNGVVLALDRRHPMLDTFTAIPLSAPDMPGVEVPPINLPPEMKQAQCIHFYENLYPGLPAPLRPGLRAHLVDDNGDPIVNERGVPVVIESSKYRLANPTGDNLPMGGAGEFWLSWAIDAEQVRADAQELIDEQGPAQMLNVEDMDDEQLAAYHAQLNEQQRRIERVLLEKERARQLDLPGNDQRTAPPEFGNWVQSNADRLREQGMPDKVVDRSLKHTAAGADPLDELAEQAQPPEAGDPQ